MIESARKKNHYAYWIIYQFQTPHSNGGAAGAKLFSTIKANSLLWIEEAQEFIKQQQSFSKVLITNWKRLKEDESWDDEANNNGREQLIIDRDHYCT